MNDPSAPSLVFAYLQGRKKSNPPPNPALPTSIGPQ